MNLRRRLSRAAAMLVVAAAPSVMAQAPARTLPERKPPVPERAPPASPSLPSQRAGGTTATRILPERKPEVPARGTAAAARATQVAPVPVKETRLGQRTEPAFLSARDRELFAQALKDAGASRWPRAQETLARASNPILRDILRWIAMRTPGAELDFTTRTTFIAAHPHWPAQAELKRITESIARDGASPTQRLQWFAQNPPTTTAGKIAYADAALATGDLPLAEKWVRDAWITGRFDARDEREFFEDFGRFITPIEHAARLEELLYTEQRGPAERMLARVDATRGAVAEARLALIAGTGNVERMMDRLTPAQLNDPGLVYDRIKWRRTRDRDDEAKALLPTMPDTAPRPDLWWRERQILARDSIAKGNYREAYTIIVNHGALDAVSVSEAEWLAGWIALRFLNNGEAALGHFQKVYDTVQLAANASRGAYWVGRAAEALGRADIAAEWYRKAALHITTFYGQLAVGRLSDPVLPQLPLDPVPAPQERTAFETKDLTKAVRALADVPNTPYLRAFVLALADSSDFAVGRHMAAELAHKLGRPDLSVWIARQAGRDRIIIMSYGFPIPAMNYAPQPEKAFVLSIIRQESNFDPNAMSPVGATGLMQLMPATAKAVAKSQKVTYNKNKLTEPAYNLRLGSAFLESLVEDFDGSYIMTAAGYNAGPGRPRQWARTYGDPREAANDAVDWIEAIPFPETRNYVQRVMENVMVYRALLSGSLTVPQSLERDLKTGIRQ